MTAATALMHNHIGGFALQREFRHDTGRDVREFPHLVAGPSVHSLSPSSPRHETYDVENSVASPTSGRTTTERAPIDSLNERDLARVVSVALQAHYGPLKASIKCIANDAGASVDAAKNWWQGICPPSSIFLARLESKVPSLAAEMRRLRAMEADHDPEFQKAFVLFMQRVGQG